MFSSNNMGFGTFLFLGLAALCPPLGVLGLIGFVIHFFIKEVIDDVKHRKEVEELKRYVSNDQF